MKTRSLLVAGLVASCACLILRADDSFTRINTGPGAVPNGSSAAAWGDFNNDGWLDLFITSFGGTQYNYCYTNNRNGTFTQILPTFFPANNINSYGCAWADYDNDGYLDLVKGISNPFGGPTQLYRNNHNGTFSNLTTVSLGNVGPGANNAVWGDYDNDGFVDLFLAVGYNAPDNVLLHNRGDGTFSRVTGNPMVTGTGISGGAAWGDYDNDGRLDLIVTRTSAGCLFYHNEGGGAFRQITNQVISTDTNGAGVSWGDYDNDGFLDLFIAHLQSPNRLYHNNGDGSFTLLTNSIIYQMTGPSSGGAWADYDNDGWLDLFVANYRGNSFLFHNDGHGDFTSVAGSTVNEYGTGQGAAWGDYDNDGFPDLLVPNIFTYNNFLYHNNGNSNAWLTLKLEGRISNRAAIGAKVRVKATIGGQTVWQLREISGGGSLGSQNDLRAGFGLRDATNVDLIRIEWPSGLVQELQNVAVRQFMTIVEQSATISPGHIAVNAGDVATFTLSTDLTPPLLFEWRHDGVLMPAATNTVLAIASVSAADAGHYSARVTQPNTGFSMETLAVELSGPIVLAPSSAPVTVKQGSNLVVNLLATGTPPITYQWLKENLPIAGATNATLVITNFQLPDEAAYSVTVSNSFGAVSQSQGTIIVLIRPVLTVQPVSRSVAAGGNATFSVSASGHPFPFTFRWLSNGAPVAYIIDSDTNSFFTVTNAQAIPATNRFTYRVVATNLAGTSASSINAFLTVLPDTDGDGLPDEWEAAHFFDPMNPNDAELDADGDGMTNAEEYQAGTDPNDATSFLRINRVSYDSTNFWRVSFMAMSNRTYSVEARESLRADSVTRRAISVVAAPTNRLIEVVCPAGEFIRQQFFRLITPHQP